MRIGIITLPLHYNYGGILQNYALQKVLKNMGHDVVTLNRPLDNAQLTLLQFLRTTLVRLIKRYVLGKKEIIFRERFMNKTLPVVSKNTLKFVDKHINIQRIKSLSSLKEDDFDAYIVGSDQIWRSYVLNIEHCFLSFTKGWNVKRLSYAASFGSSKWQYDNKTTERLKACVKHFDAISVREYQGKLLCEEYLEVESELLIDPTLLLHKEDYIKLCIYDSVSKGGLLTYVLDENEEKTDLTDSISENLGLLPFKVNSRAEDIFAPLEERIQKPVEQWIRGFYDADFVVTDSFHACVFSIIFHKPFVVIGNEKRGISRFETLLEMFHLKSRMIKDFDDYLKIKDEDISFSEIDNIISEKRKQAFEFLNKNL